MKITLHNIGKIGEATIELNGITVIAGENDTGKSTVGKALYSVFNSLYRINEQIDRERSYSIERIVGIISQYPYPFRNIDEDYLGMKKFIENTKNHLQNSDLLQKEIENLLAELKKYLKQEIYEKEREEYIKKITEILQVSDDEIFKATLLQKLALEFNGQINNIYVPNTEGQIELRIKDIEIKISLLNDEITNVPNQINLNTEVIYIDDPFILDEGKRFSLGHDNTSKHRDYLKSNLFTRKMESNVINEIITTKKLKNILSKINTVCSGEMVKTSSNSFGYKKNGGESILDIKNLSTGLKTFVILKTLLKNGTLEENGTIVLDEPEIHLHPKWQLLFAELIVLIQKEFGMHILINTHSPYFLNAIEVYAEKHKILEKCKFYLAENTGETSNIVDVTREIDKIYAKLAKPLQDLENLRYSDD